MGSYRVCCCFTRRFGFTESEPPSEIKELFKKYVDGGYYMTPEQLRRFLVEEQGLSDATTADAEKIVEDVLNQRHHIAKFTRNSLPFEDFFFFLFSVQLNPHFKPKVIYYFFIIFFIKKIIIMESESWEQEVLSS